MTKPFGGNPFLFRENPFPKYALVLNIVSPIISLGRPNLWVRQSNSIQLMYQFVFRTTLPVYLIRPLSDPVRAMICVVCIETCRVVESEVFSPYNFMSACYIRVIFYFDRFNGRGFVEFSLKFIGFAGASAKIFYTAEDINNNLLHLMLRIPDELWLISIRLRFFARAFFHRETMFVIFLHWLASSSCKGMGKNCLWCTFLWVWLRYNSVFNFFLTSITSCAIHQIPYLYFIRSIPVFLSFFTPNLILSNFNQ